MDDTVQLRRFDNMVLLRNCPLFSGLAPSQLQRIVLMAKELRFSKGETILNIGGAVDSLYVIKEGSCSYGGDVFRSGEAVFEHAVFIPNYTAKEKLVPLEDVVFVAIEQSDMYDMLLNNPGTTVRMLERFSERIESLERLE